MKKIYNLYFIALSFIFLHNNLKADIKNTATGFRGHGSVQSEIPKSELSKKILVAVIDTGLEISHPKIKNQIWINNKEIPNNQIDDDKNGFIDDVNGWDFVNRTGFIRDPHGHGTHVTGLITSASPQILVLPLRYYSAELSALDTILFTAQAFSYAIQMGAQIINYSGGGPTSHPLEREILKLAEKKGILVVAALGNEGQNIDQHPYFPASYPYSNILRVGGVSQSGQRVESSNFSFEKRMIYALGENVESALPNGKSGKMTGTSQATAITTGIAALMRLTHPGLSPSEVIHRLNLAGAVTNSAKTAPQIVLHIQRSISSADSLDIP